jgi:hypothetical protein
VRATITLEGTEYGCTLTSQSGPPGGDFGWAAKLKQKKYAVPAIFRDRHPGMFGRHLFSPAKAKTPGSLGPD